MQELTRISIDPAVMGGKPCIRGMRVTVGMIVGALEAGRSFDEVLTDFPYLDEDDIRQALAYVAIKGTSGFALGDEVKPMAGNSMDDVIDVYKKDIDVTLLKECLRRTVPERMEALQRALTAIEELREQVARTTGKSA